MTAATTPRPRLTPSPADAFLIVTSTSASGQRTLVPPDVLAGDPLPRIC